MGNILFNLKLVINYIDAHSQILCNNDTLCGQTCECHTIKEINNSTSKKIQLSLLFSIK